MALIWFSSQLIDSPFPLLSSVQLIPVFSIRTRVVAGVEGGVTWGGCGVLAELVLSAPRGFVTREDYGLRIFDLDEEDISRNG